MSEIEKKNAKGFLPTLTKCLNNSELLSRKLARWTIWTNPAHSNRKSDQSRPLNQVVDTPTPTLDQSFPFPCLLFQILPACSIL